MENKQAVWALDACAKVNLTLDVLGKRPDGYHELRTLMARTPLCDRVFLEDAPPGTVRVTCDAPLPPENSAWRAARRYMADYGGGARIHIQKRIPSEAGLGGASADAAAVLALLRERHGCPSEAALYAMARDIGADVPFCLYATLRGPGALALCEGVGERLTPLAPLPSPLPVLIVKGERGVSTAALFASLPLPPRERPDTAAALAALARGDMAALAGLLCNSLEAAAVAQRPEIALYKARLMDAGALGAAMSGSGASVFGLFASPEAAREARARFADAPFAFCPEL